MFLNLFLNNVTILCIFVSTANINSIIYISHIYVRKSINGRRRKESAQLYRTDC